MAKSATAIRLPGVTDGDIEPAWLTAYVDLTAADDGRPNYKMVVPTDGQSYNLVDLLNTPADEYGVVQWHGLGFKLTTVQGKRCLAITANSQDPERVKTFDAFLGAQVAAIRLGVLEQALTKARSPLRKMKDQTGEFMQRLEVSPLYFGATLMRMLDYQERTVPILVTTGDGEPSEEG